MKGSKAMIRLRKMNRRTGKPSIDLTVNPVHKTDITAVTIGDTQRVIIHLNAANHTDKSTYYISMDRVDAEALIEKIQAAIKKDM